MFGLSSIKVFGVLAIVLAFLSWGWYTHHLQVKVESLLQTNAVIASQLKDQNAAIQTLATAANQKLISASKELQAAANVADALNKQAKNIYDLKGSGCDDSLALINGVLK